MTMTPQQRSRRALLKRGIFDRLRIMLLVVTSVFMIMLTVQLKDTVALESIIPTEKEMKETGNRRCDSVCPPTLNCQDWSKCIYQYPKHCGNTAIICKDGKVARRLLVNAAEVDPTRMLLISKTKDPRDGMVYFILNFHLILWILIFIYAILKRPTQSAIRSRQCRHHPLITREINVKKDGHIRIGAEKMSVIMDCKNKEVTLLLAKCFYLNMHTHTTQPPKTAATTAKQEESVAVTIEE